MATVKGFIRAYGAAVRRVERERQREAREAAKRFKEQQKLQAIEDAKIAVYNWNRYVQMLISLHKNSSNAIDWNALKSQTKPVEPENQKQREKSAIAKLKSYRPSWFDSLFKLTSKKVRRLESKILEARSADNEEYNQQKADYENELNEWESLQKLASGVQSRNPEVYKEVMVYFDPFSDIKELATSIDFSFDSESADVDLHINEIDVIPNEEFKLTSTGKLSRKAMAKSKFYELYQDHVCSCVLRVALELFALFPISHVRIHAMTKLLNPKTGHLEVKPILSVLIPPETIRSLNLDKIDPSESMRNFKHNMSFKKTIGFSQVEKIN